MWLFKELQRFENVGAEVLDRWKINNVMFVHVS